MQIESKTKFECIDIYSDNGYYDAIFVDSNGELLLVHNELRNDNILIPPNGMCGILTPGQIATLK